MVIGICTGFFIINATGSWDVPVSGYFEVSIPAQITVVNASSDITYNVSASGELHPYDKVVIKPESATVVFTKISDSTDTRTVNISQDTTKLKVCEDTTDADTKALATQEFEVNSEGTISIAEANLTAGAWTAQLNFTIGYQNNSQADYFSGFNTETGESGHYDTQKATDDGVTVAVIPSEINDVPVTKLSTFWTSTSNLDSLYMPDSIVELTDGCFTDVTAKYIRLSNNLTTIPGSCFYNCGFLETINIPTGITEIGSYAFFGAASLQGIDLPETLVSIGYHAFEDTDSLTALTFPSSLTEFGVNGTGDYATVIKNCDNLKTVVFKGPIFYGTDAIYACYNLESVTFNDTAARKNTKNQFGWAIEPRFIYDCGNSFSVTFTNHIDRIDDGFLRSSGVNKVVFENGCGEIGKNAFTSCSYLTEIDMNDVETVGYQAFSGCSKLGVMDMPNVSTILEGAFQSSGITAAKLPKLINMGNNVFYLCSKLEKVEVPLLTKVPTGAFRYCYALSQINIKIGEGQMLGVSEEPNSFADSAMVELQIPDSVYSAFSYQFSDCYDLGEVRLPQNSRFKSIYSGMFYGCESLEHIDIPDSVSNIGSYAFSWSGLKEIDLTGISFLGIESFSNTQLTEVAIPASCMNDFKFYTVGSTFTLDRFGWTFMDCENLTTVTFEADVETLAKAKRDAFYLDPENNENDMVFIPGGMFNGCAQLTSIAIPEGIAGIGSEAFADSGITSDGITIPDTVEFFGLFVFDRTPWDSEASDNLQPIIINNQLVGGTITNYSKLSEEIDVISTINIPWKDKDTLYIAYVKPSFTEETLLFGKPRPAITFAQPDTWDEEMFTGKIVLNEQQAPIYVITPL